MFLLLASLLLHQGYALISVTTAQLGEPVTFTCFFPDFKNDNYQVKWYKQTVGDSLKLITTLMKSSENPTFDQAFTPLRFNANHTMTESTLTILKTVQEDEAVYHCGVVSWSKDQWSGTYLSIKDNVQRTMNMTVVQWPTMTDPVHPGESVTLQCSVHSDSGTRTCPGIPRVLWFRVKSDKSHTNIIYTDGNRHNGCDNKPDSHSPQKTCVYRFSKTVDSSDAGTYYCAVATCGEIFFGDGTKLGIEANSPGSILHTENIFGFLLFAVLAVSTIATGFFIYAIKKNKCSYCLNKAAVSLHGDFSKRNLKRDGEKTYSAVFFTMMKTGSNRTKGSKADRERIFTAVENFALE